MRCTHMQSASLTPRSRRAQRLRMHGPEVPPRLQPRPRPRLRPCPTPRPHGAAATQLPERTTMIGEQHRRRASVSGARANAHLSSAATKATMRSAAGNSTDADALPSCACAQRVYVRPADGGCGTQQPRTKGAMSQATPSRSASAAAAAAAASPGGSARAAGASAVTAVVAASNRRRAVMSYTRTAPGV